METTLAEELALLQRYAEVPEARYGDRLQVSFEVEPGVRGALVPRLILQPLVENAIRHGVTRRITPGRVDVRAWEREGKLHLVVRDDGVGLRTGAPVREGVGLSITRERLRQLYGADQRLRAGIGSRGRRGLQPFVPVSAGSRGDVTAPPIRALIVDDEPLARARLRTLLAKHADMQVVGECAEGSEATAAIGRVRPDVVFLDIQMTEQTGLDVAAALEQRALPAIVFVTAHERYALERSRCTRSTTCSSRSRRSASRPRSPGCAPTRRRSGASARTSTSSPSSAS